MDSYVVVAAFAGVVLVFMIICWIVGRSTGKTPEVHIKFEQYKSREHLT
jgi:hypothetical protein